MTGQPATPGFFRTLCWAVYLGCSWTWCIGMFLPVILVSEYGLAAWLIFAIPNVIGAAAMGWTLAKPGSSQRMVAQHRAACMVFSAVTLAFHLFFLFWLTHIGLMPMQFSITAVVIGFAFGWIGRRRIGLDFILGILVLCMSLSVLGKGLMHPVFGVQHPVKTPISPAVIAGLSAVCLLGFLLCPYLDITFHRARQETQSRAGKTAFGVGFGVVFLLMIVLTLMYAGDFALDRSPSDFFGSFGGVALISWVGLHIAAQAGFTFAAHLRALPRPIKSDAIIWGAAGVMVLAAMLGLKQELWSTLPGMLSGDLIYRLFMSSYGLIFPAYVWICIVPISGHAPGPSRPALIATAIAVGLATPLYWLGFVDERMIWLLPGVGIVLLAGVLIRLPVEISYRVRQ